MKRYGLTNKGKQHINKLWTKIRLHPLLNPPTHAGKGRIVLYNMASPRLLEKSFTKEQLDALGMKWAGGEKDPKRALAIMKSAPVYMSPEDIATGLQWAIKKGYISDESTLKRVNKQFERGEPIASRSPVARLPKRKPMRITPKTPRLRR